VNTGASWPGLDEARARVLEIQTKLHRWATDAPDRRFGDLYNLVCDPAFLRVGWDRVRGNRGARTAGVDGVKPRSIDGEGDEQFLRALRADLKARRFCPLPVRERMIPKASGKLRRLGIPTARDRVVQASLKLVLEPIFEADFKPCSYGFRPMRRAQDAIEEIHHFGRLSYEWVLEADIASCFDEISHPALMDRVRERVADKRVLGLVKAFLIAGILSQDGTIRGTKTGTPQGGILSPLLANIALSVLDEHFAEAWEAMMASDLDRRRRRCRGEPLYRLVRYADDFVVLVSGTKAQAEALQAETAAVLSTIGLRLSQEKTEVCHINEGFDFLGMRIQRKRKRGSNKVFVYSWPSKKALASIMAKIKAITRQGTNQPLSALLRQLNAALRGWTVYFRHGCSKQTFDYLGHYTWRRVVGWLRRKHRRATWKSTRRRYMRTVTARTLVPHDDGIALFNPASVPVTRYRYRGTKIANPWTERTQTIKATA
jgi:RNA-directed DNA polymerase